MSTSTEATELEVECHHRYLRALLWLIDQFRTELHLFLTTTPVHQLNTRDACCPECAGAGHLGRCHGQSEASIKVTWSLSVNQRPVSRHCGRGHDHSEASIQVSSKGRQACCSSRSQTCHQTKIALNRNCRNQEVLWKPNESKCFRNHQEYRCF